MIWLEECYSFLFLFKYQGKFIENIFTFRNKVITSTLIAVVHYGHDLTEKAFLYFSSKHRNLMVVRKSNI